MPVKGKCMPEAVSTDEADTQDGTNLMHRSRR